jgi:hypothetical protein
VVWSLRLTAGSEVRTLISCAASHLLQCVCGALSSTYHERRTRLPPPYRREGTYPADRVGSACNVAARGQRADDIGRILGAIQGPTSSFVEPLATIAATGPPVTLRGALRPLRNRCPSACDAFDPPCSPLQELHARTEPSPELRSGVNADGTPQQSQRGGVRSELLFPPPPFRSGHCPRSSSC